MSDPRDPDAIRASVGQGMLATLDAFDDETIRLAMRAVTELAKLAEHLEARGLSKAGSASTITGMVLRTVWEAG